MVCKDLIFWNVRPDSDHLCVLGSITRCSHRSLTRTPGLCLPHDLHIKSGLLTLKLYAQAWADHWFAFVWRIYRDLVPPVPKKCVQERLRSLNTLGSGWNYWGICMRIDRVRRLEIVHTGDFTVSWEVNPPWMTRQMNPSWKSLRLILKCKKGLLNRRQNASSKEWGRWHLVSRYWSLINIWHQFPDGQS